MTKLVEVPMIVKQPPNILANDSGIKNSDGAKPLERAQSLVIGIRIARNIF